MRTQILAGLFELAVLASVTPAWRRAVIAGIAAHWLRVASLRFNFRSNRGEILYLRAYDDPVDPAQLPGNVLSKGLHLAMRNNKRLEHMVQQYLQIQYDMVGLLPPPRTDYERALERSTRRMPESKYLLRTVDDAQWQTTVRHLIGNCDAVIVECTRMTDALRWEIGEVLRQRGARPLFLVARAEDRKAAMEVYAAIRKMHRKGGGRHEVREPLLHAAIDRTKIRAMDARFGVTLLRRIAEIAPRREDASARALGMAVSRLLLGWTGILCGAWSVAEFAWLVMRR